MNVGYFTLSVTAEPGTRTVAHAVENIEHIHTEKEWVQHTANKMNGFRVIYGEGATQWTARERRGARYLQLVINHTDQPVTIHRVALIESTYDAPREPQKSIQTEGGILSGG